MKKYIIGILIIVIITVIVWFFMFKNKNLPQTTVVKLDTNNQIDTNQPKTSPNVKKQNTPEIVNPVVAKDFKSQITNSNMITLYNTTVTDNYALQEWGDANKGGVALLKYQDNQGWLLLSLGGGAWDLPSLLEIGVPKLAAEKLLETRGSR